MDVKAQLRKLWNCATEEERRALEAFTEAGDKDKVVEFTRLLMKKYRKEMTDGKT